MQEICQSGSEGGAKPTFVPTPIVPRKNRPVGYGMIGRSESQRYFSSTCGPCLLTEAKYSS